MNETDEETITTITELRAKVSDLENRLEGARRFYTSHLTIKDQFALAALPGIIASDTSLSCNEISDMAYLIADCMLYNREINGVS